MIDYTLRRVALPTGVRLMSLDGDQSVASAALIFRGRVAELLFDTLLLPSA